MFAPLRILSRVTCLMLLLVLSATTTAGGQQDEMKMIERVAELQRQLADPQVPRRDEAERELLEIGVPALDHLEQPDKDATDDTLMRLDRVRRELETRAVSQVSQASTVQLEGPATWTEILGAIGEQTGNSVQLSPAAGQALDDQPVQLKMEGITFWEAIDQLCELGSLQIDPYRSSAGHLQLTPVISAEPGAPSPEQPPRAVANVFQATALQVVGSRHLENPSLSYTTVRLRVRWEPRLTPISLSIPAESVVAEDDNQQKLTASNPQAVFSATVLPNIPEVEFSLPLAAVNRSAEQLEHLDFQLNAVIPGRQETFRFRNLGRLKPGFKQTKAGVVVAFEGIRQNEDLYGVTLAVSFDNDHRALESHFRWIAENPVVLIDDQGKRWTPLAQESLGQAEGRARMQYFFDRDPLSMELEYQTPAAIVAVPVKLRLRGIPLP